MNLDPFPLFLVIFSGVCWTLVYVEGIRVGMRDRSYAIPFWALALNLAWELLNAALQYRLEGAVVQVWISSLWFLMDLGILYTYFRHGRVDSPTCLPSAWFLPWSLLVLAIAFVLQSAFILEFGLMVGRAYAAFLQNLLMSVLFISMLVARGHRGGQSLAIAVSKWLGTLAPTILFGLVGTQEFEGPNGLLLVLGVFCSVFDLMYIWLLTQARSWRALAPSARDI
jgi:hypothetical protein